MIFIVRSGAFRLNLPLTGREIIPNMFSGKWFIFLVALIGFAAGQARAQDVVLTRAGLYTSNTTEAAAIWGDTLWCAGKRLRGVDLNNPASLRGEFTLGADEINYVRFNDIKIRGGLAYCIGVMTGLAVFDVTNPTAPKQIGYYADGTSFYHHRIAIDGHYAVLSGALVVMAPITLPLRVMDISQTTPTLVAEYVSHSGLYSFTDAAIAGNLVYAADCNNGGLRILEIQAGSLIPRGSVPMACFGCLALQYPYVYLTATGSDPGLATELVVCDVSNPDAPFKCGSMPLDGGYELSIYKNHLFVGGDIVRVFDLSYPREPRLCGSYQMATSMDELSWGLYSAKMLFDDDKIYFGAGDAGLEIVNLSFAETAARNWTAYR